MIALMKRNILFKNEFFFSSFTSQFFFEHQVMRWRPLTCYIKSKRNIYPLKSYVIILKCIQESLPVNLQNEFYNKGTFWQPPEWGMPAVWSFFPPSQQGRLWVHYHLISEPVSCQPWEKTKAVTNSWPFGFSKAKGNSQQMDTSYPNICICQF